jgi:lipopolysaccharide heptosyltransferase II
MRSFKTNSYINILRYVINDVTKCFFIRKLGIRFKKIPNSILIANFHGIGNMVLFTPVLQTLRAVYPRAKIIVIVANRGAKDVIFNSGLVNKIIEYDSRNDKNGANFLEIVNYLRGMDIDLGFSCSQNSIEPLFLFEANVKYRAGFLYKTQSVKRAKFLLHFAIEHDMSKHEVIQNLDLLSPIGVDEFIINPSFYFEPKHLESAYKKLESRGVKLSNPMIGFHAGCHVNLVKKRWPLENFARLATELIAKYNAQAVFVGDNSEKGDINNIASMMDHHVANLAGILSLKETAAIVSKMRLFISNDSGPMHIAAGVGTPVIGIFGPTREDKNSPWPRNDVPAMTVREPMACAPCYVSYSGNIDCDHMSCLRQLTPEKVLAACEDILNKDQKRVAG